VLPHSIPFDAAHPAWDEIPAAAGVFALFADDARAEPYVSRTPNLRRRLRRLLDPRPDQSRRLQLAGRVARIEYALTASDFESLLRLYLVTRHFFGDRARKRLHLRQPYLLRMTVENAYPRVYVTHHIAKSSLDDLYGPFPSRAAAEKFLEDMLDLFRLRRCHEELHPDPSFPGCVYSEMKKCLAPCFQGCTDDRYAEESASVRAFLRTRGASLVETLRREREAASALLEFERAAELHARLTRAEAVAAAAPEALRPLAHLDAVIIQPSAEPDSVALFRLAQGALCGPATYSVAGMRHPNEAAGSTSLFPQPVAAMEAVPLDAPAVTFASRDELEQRLERALAELNPPSARARQRISSAHLADFLCLFTRWYYRPAIKRAGEIVFADAEGNIPSRTVLRCISRVWRHSQISPSQPAGMS
jgi:excinuclease ABC subunit C